MKKEISILFSTQMVQAILEGRKTMTRRVVKAKGSFNGVPLTVEDIVNHAGQCPYGKPGDMLWVREEHYRYGQWVEKEGVFTKRGRQKWQFIPHTDEIRYSDNPPEEFRKGMHNKDPHHIGWYKRLARFMPKSAARIWLEVTDIRVERLQDISEEDAKAEGIEVLKQHEEFTLYKKYTTPGISGGFTQAKNSFSTLWESINGEESWNQNPWVWVVAFKVLSTTGRPVEKATSYNFTNRNNLETSHY